MRFRTTLAITTGTLALAACGSGATGGGGGAAPARLQAPGAAVAEHGAAKSATDSTIAETGGGGPVMIGTPPPQVERAVTARYTVPAGSFVRSFESVISAGVDLGGYVASSATQPDGRGRMVRGSVVLRIPAARIAAFLNGMPGDFDASSIDFSSVDHTAQFVDVNARLASAHAHLDALNRLLGRAVSLSDIATLEQQVEAVQSEIDSEQGALNELTSAVELATATVALVERGVAVAAPPPPPGPVGGGLAGGWHNAVQITGAVVEGAVSALPLLALALGAWAFRRRLLRLFSP